MSTDTPNQPPKRPTLSLKGRRQAPVPEPPPPAVAAALGPVAGGRPGGREAVAAKPAAGAGKGKTGKPPAATGGREGKGGKPPVPKKPPPRRTIDGKARKLMSWLGQHSTTWRDNLPLNIGVINEVYALLDSQGVRDAWSKRTIHKALQWHTGTGVYQGNMLSCPHRHGLDGAVGGEVTDAQRGHAREVLEKLATRKAAAKQGEHQQ